MEVKYEIRNPLPVDEEELFGIWRDIFGDGEDFTDLFRRDLYSPRRSVVALVDGNIAAGCHVVPLGEFSHELGGGPCAVTYALACLPEYRGRGLGAASANAAKGMAFRMGTPVICPAEVSLFDYYRDKCGYETMFYEEIAEGAARGYITVSCISAGEYSTMRENYLAGIPHIIFSTECISFQEYICSSCGGGLFRLTGDNSVFCVAAMMDGEKAVIKEILGTGCITDAAAGLANSMGASHFIAHLPASDISSARPFAMAAGDLKCLIRMPYLPWMGFDFD